MNQIHWPARIPLEAAISERTLTRHWSRPRKAASVFEEILGIPAHPLLVHAAVVFVPLAAAAAIAYALVPYVRRHTAWLVVALAIVAPVTAWVTKMSGDAFRARLIRHGTTSQVLLDKISVHMGFGQKTEYWSLGLGVLMLLLVFLPTLRANAPAGPLTNMVTKVVLMVLTVGVAGATGYYVFRTGDTGAHIVWSGM
jgi:uncharacterized membrane protein